MATAGTISIDLQTTGTATMRKSLRDASKSIEEFGKTSKGVLSQLKEGFGRGSTLTQTLKVLHGGGAIMGLKLAVSSIKELAEGVRDLTNQYREGAISGGEFAEKIWESLPILGNLRKAGLAIRETFLGKDDYTKFEEQLKSNAAATEAWRQAVIALAEDQLKLTDVLERQALARGEGKGFSANANAGKIRDEVTSRNDALDKAAEPSKSVQDNLQKLKEQKAATDNSMKFKDYTDAELRPFLMRQNQKLKEATKAGQTGNAEYYQSKVDDIYAEMSKRARSKGLAQEISDIEDPIKRMKAQAGGGKLRNSIQALKEGVSPLGTAAKGIYDTIKEGVSGKLDQAGKDAKLPGILHKFIGKTMEAGESLINNAKAKQFSDQKKAEKLANESIRTVAAREFRFQNGVPGESGNPIDRLVKAATTTNDTLQRIADNTDPTKNQPLDIP